MQSHTGGRPQVTGRWQQAGPVIIKCIVAVTPFAPLDTVDILFVSRAAFRSIEC